jgi:hypothetical protein
MTSSPTSRPALLHHKDILDFDVGGLHLLLVEGLLRGKPSTHSVSSMH